MFLDLGIRFGVLRQRGRRSTVGVLGERLTRQKKDFGGLRVIVADLWFRSSGLAAHAGCILRRRKAPAPRTASARSAPSPVTTVLVLRPTLGCHRGKLPVRSLGCELDY